MLQGILASDSNCESAEDKENCQSIEVSSTAGLAILQTRSNLSKTPCKKWCKSDYESGRNQGRHCAGVMANLCGGCDFCQKDKEKDKDKDEDKNKEGACKNWCYDDYKRGKNRGRHCGSGDMISLCGGCDFCQKDKDKDKDKDKKGACKNR